MLFDQLSSIVFGAIALGFCQIWNRSEWIQEKAV